jgi:hypothetical protein
MFRKVLLSAGVVLLIFLLWRLGPSEIVGLLRRIGWYALLVVSLYAAHHAVRALSLHLCVLRRRVLGYHDALAIRLSGEAVHSLTWTGPFLAEPTRAWLLKRRGLTLQEGFAATIILFSVFLVAAAVAIGARFYLIGTIIAGLAHIGVLRGRLRPDMPWINRMEDLLLAVLRDRPVRVLAVSMLEIVAQALLVVELFWLLHALDMPVTLFYVFVIEASMKIIGVAFPFIPLHVGVAEGGYALIFDVMGLPPVAGFTIAFVRRLRSLLVASVGLTLLALLTRDRSAS